ncbi:MAG: phosphopantothenoylcysteine decarboxylase [Sedimentisphaerales bacterium]|nr:phosphopantothenoylcysteine decarboxylase [Sedimentisphaerales bacterium]
MTTNLKGFEILLGVTGGIAAYKAAALCSMLSQAHARVTVVMTENAQRFVTPLTFSTLSHRPVYTDLWAPQQDPEHIALADRADIVVVAPATANIIAKFATGICDDLLSTTLIASDGDILLAPAMNNRMWQNAATQRNITTLTNQGIQFVGPAVGMLACGTTGTGRMAEPQEILERIAKILQGKSPKNS